MGEPELSVPEKIMKQSRRLFHIYSDIASALDLSESSFWIMYVAYLVITMCSRKYQKNGRFLNKQLILQ